MDPRDAYPSEEVWDEIERNSLWHKLLRERQAAEPEWDADLIPNVTAPVEFDDSFKQHIRNLSASEALLRLTFKHPLPTRLRAGDGNKFRCPWEGHIDETPSAWLDTTKNVWCCVRCGNVGGDWIDLAAAARGYTTPGQKLRDTGRFADLMRQLEAEFGWNSRPVGYAESGAPLESPAVVKSRWNLNG